MAPDAPETSWFERKVSFGSSWWGRLPVAVRHVVYWGLVVLLLLPSALDDSSRPGTEHAEWSVLVGVAAWSLSMGVVGLVWTLREAASVRVVRTVSRSLALFGCMLGISSILIGFARGDAAFQACRSEQGADVCDRPASPRQVLAALAWNGADVVPVLEISDSFQWERPARSESVVAGGVILIVRLWVAVGVLGVVNYLWERWKPTPDPPQASN